MGSHARYARTSPPYIYVTRTGIFGFVLRRFWSVSEISVKKIRVLLEGCGGSWICSGFLGPENDRLMDFGVINRLSTGY